MKNTFKMLCSMAAAGLVASNVFSLVGRISVKTLTLSKTVVLRCEGEHILPENVQLSELLLVSLHEY